MPNQLGHSDFNVMDQINLKCNISSPLHFQMCKSKAADNKEEIGTYYALGIHNTVKVHSKFRMYQRYRYEFQVIIEL